MKAMEQRKDRKYREKNDRVRENSNSSRCFWSSPKTWTSI